MVRRTITDDEIALIKAMVERGMKTVTSNFSSTDQTER